MKKTAAASRSDRQSPVLRGVLPALCVVLAAFAFVSQPPRELLHGFWQILISDAGLITDPAVTGGAGAALLNAALVLALSTALVYAMHLPVTGLTFACLFMMAGFSLLGKNLLNILPVLLGGFILGPWFGALVGVLSPLVSSLLTAMPALARLPFMMIELAVYGLVSGLMYNTFKFNKKKMGTYISLLTAMLCGRIVYAISLFVAVNLMGIQCGGPIAAVTATVSGVPGIIIQVLIIPPVVYALERSGYIDRYFRICKGTVA